MYVVIVLLIIIYILCIFGSRYYIIKDLRETYKNIPDLKRTKLRSSDFFYIFIPLANMSLAIALVIHPIVRVIILPFKKLIGLKKIQKFWIWFITIK